MSIKEKVLTILNKVKPTKNLEGISNIVEGGYIDSFELLMLITALSEEFNIDISVDDITPENFNSVNCIVEMIERLSSDSK